MFPVARSVHSLAKETYAEVCELKYGGKGNAAPSHIPFSLEPGGDGWSQSSHLVTMKEKPSEQLRSWQKLRLLPESVICLQSSY